MTLSGDGDPRQRRAKAAAGRRDLDARAPWVRTVLIAVAVLVVAAVAGYAIISGTLF